MPATAVMEGHRFFFPRDAPWLADLEAELLQFPHGRHDDMVDVCGWASIVASKIPLRGSSGATAIPYRKATTSW